MARGFLYVYERIYKGEPEMQTEFRKIPVNGKRTSVADQKRVRKIISDNAHRIAQERGLEAACGCAERYRSI